MITAKIPKIDPPLSPAEREAYRIRSRPLISDWCEQHISLKKGYSNKGPIRLYPWQVEPANAIMRWGKVLFLGPTQTGKSFLADLAVYYAMAVMFLEGMVIYANEKVAKKVFKRRIKPMIMLNPELSKHWSGKDDDLSIENITLNTCFWGVASAQNRNDIASFPAGLVVWSEVAKAEDVDYDVAAEIEGRQESYSPDRRKQIFETTPNYKGDPMYREVFKPGTIILEPHVQCPHCGAWQVLTDEQVRVVGDDHNSHRIRVQKEAAVRYECPHCKEEIREEHRPRMFERVVWAASEIDERVSDSYTYHQAAEKILPDGTVVGDRSWVLTPCYHWNRLVDYKYTFWNCLARFFDAQKSPEKWHVYLNNDMARFWAKKAERVARSFIEAKSLNSEYYQAGKDSLVPDGAIVLTCMMDTQDDGWWFVVVGWGENLESWRVRIGWVACGMHEERFKDKREILKVVSPALYGEPYLRMVDGKPVSMQIEQTFIDRGGHRAEDVDFLVKNLPRCKAYIGSPRDDPKKDMVWETDDGFIYGKTEMLSEIVGAMMTMDSWHLPHDTPQEYFSQVVRQYHYKEIMRNGNEKIVWRHGGEDHLRDCENGAYGAAVWIGLDSSLFNPNAIAVLRKKMAERASAAADDRRSDISGGPGVEKKQSAPASRPKISSSFLSGPARGRTGSYFGGRRW